MALTSRARGVRFRAYGVPVDANAAAYIDSIYGLPAMQEWLAAAAVEAEVLPHTDNVASATA